MTKQEQPPDMFVNYVHNDRVRRLPVDFVNHIEEAVLVLAQSAIRGQAKTLKQHFGTEVWKAISDGQPVLAGYCMAYLVAKHLVPFKAMGIDPGSKAQMYALI